MPDPRGIIATIASAVLLAACHSLPRAPPPRADYQSGFTEVGLASWYGAQFQRKRTASGERFDMSRLTAAHRTLPLNSYVRVTNLATGRSVVVRINDRGPYVSERVIDLSAEAARALGMKDEGLARVRIKLLSASEARLW